MMSLIYILSEMLNVNIVLNNCIKFATSFKKVTIFPLYKGLMHFGIRQILSYLKVDIWKTQYLQ